MPATVGAGIEESSGENESVEQSSDDDDGTSSIDSAQPKFPVGTRFIKVRMNVSLSLVLIVKNDFVICSTCNIFHPRRSSPVMVDLKAASLTLTANAMKSTILKTGMRK
jgi:hypothetical protein